MDDLPVSLAPEALAHGLLEMLQTSGALASIKDAQSGRYLWANPRCVEFLVQQVPGDARAYLGASDLDLLPMADAGAVRAADQRALLAGMPSAGEHRFERQGQKLDFRTLRQTVAGTQPGQTLLISLWWDDSAPRRSAEQLKMALAQVARQQVAIDELAREQHEGRDRPTELFRREQFEEHLQREWALSTREHREFALVLLAIDGLDQLAQRHGAAAAEQMPKAVAQMVRANTRAMDVISHVADGRLAILLSGVGLATAHTRMEQIRRQCVTHFVVHEGEPLGFTVSIGIASFPHTAGTLQGLSESAERSLAQAGQRGGNRVVLATISLAGAADALGNPSPT
jgi:diguanylate cyclase (GGDEF)-like protein